MLPAAVAALLVALALPAGALAQPFDLEDSLECEKHPTDSGQEQEICSGQVPSFDGATLDVDVTKPLASARGQRHPLIVMLHGFGNDKHEWQYLNDEGEGHDKWHWNSHWFAQHGYYVLTYTARGFRTDRDEKENQPHTEPGTSISAPNGTIHLKSKEFEIRDTQWLSALVAGGFEDVDPERVAVTGGSYGGGESWLQASQHQWTVGQQCSQPDPQDRPDFCRPVVDPETGEPTFTDPVFDKALPVLDLQVAVPKYPWTDQSYGLQPNGHPRPASRREFEENDDGDFEPVGPPIPCQAGAGGPGDDPTYESAQGCAESDTGDGNPFGVVKLSYTNGLFALGASNGVYESGTTVTPNTEGPINIPAAYERTTVQGDPYDVGGAEDPIIRQVRRGLTEYRSAYYQEDGWDAQDDGRKVAVYSIQGWTDDLFTAVESFRMFKYLKRLDPRWPVEVELADVGHDRAQNRASTWHRLNNRAFQFLNEHLSGSHEQETTVASQQTICAEEPGEGERDREQVEHPPAERLTAQSPEGLSNGRLSVTYTPGSTINNPGGTFDPRGPRSDPILGPGGCQETSDDTPFPGLVKYSALSNPVKQTRTYLGLGSVRLPLTAVSANTATVNVRVWDRPPEGRERLMTRGTYRYDVPYDPAVTPASPLNLDVPLFGNHFVLEPRHRIRLEVTLVDFPFLRPSNVLSSATFGPPRLTLPTRQAAVEEMAGAPLP